MNTVSDIREKLIEKYLNKDFVVLNDGRSTVELIGESFIANEDNIFCKPNNAYIEREINWYKSQSLNVYDIKGGKIPEVWKKVADKYGNINSNYGWCIWSAENHNQYRNCLKQLLDDNSSRRASMIYIRPSMQYDYCTNGMSDFMCTFSTQQFIRDNKLVYIVYQRSMDAIFGYRNDRAWHLFVAKSLVKDLKDNNININDEPVLIWSSGSTHVYSNHFSHIEEFIKNKS